MDSKPDAAFGGFPKALFSFFEDLRANNDREWFQAHKPRYQEQVAAPLKAFIAAMEPRLERISPYYAGSMFRIYRDIRFSRDKTPYKEHGAVQFRHVDGRDVHAPGFYLHLSPDEVVFGGGTWRPPADALRAIRERFVEEPDQWQQVKDKVTGSPHFEGIEGDSLKRPPRGFDADAPHLEDVKRKSFYVMSRCWPEDAQQDDFIDRVEAAYRDAAPLVRYICETVGRRF